MASKDLTAIGKKTPKGQKWVNFKELNEFEAMAPAKPNGKAV